MNEQRLIIEKSALEFVERVRPLTDIAEVGRELQMFIVKLGFDNVCCMKVPEVGEVAADQILVNTNPAGWAERYLEKNYVKRDPMVVELFKTVDPYAWSDVLERRELIKQDKRIVDEASEFKMNDGLIVPIFTPEGYTGLVSVTAQAPELSDDIRSALSLACVFAHNKLLALKRKKEIESVRLTPREMECLCWVSYGKSDWETGEILRISEKTVNHHVENVKKKFGVATRLQAVAIAIRQGSLLPY